MSTSVLGENIRIKLDSSDSVSYTYNFGSLLRLMVPSNLAICRSTSSSTIVSFADDVCMEAVDGTSFRISVACLDDEAGAISFMYNMSPCFKFNECSV